MKGGGWWLNSAQALGKPAVVVDITIDTAQIEFPRRLGPVVERPTPQALKDDIKEARWCHSSHEECSTTATTDVGVGPTDSRNRFVAAQNDSRFGRGFWNDFESDYEPCHEALPPGE